MRFKHTFLLLMLMGVLSSCVMDSMEENVDSSVGTIHLKIQIPEEVVETRAIQLGKEAGEEALHENRIESIQLFFFDYNRGHLVWKPTAKDFTMQPDGNIAVNIPTMEVRKELGASPIQIYIVANESPIDIQTSEELLNYQVESNDFAERRLPKEFVMIGDIVKELRFVGNRNNLGEVELKRLAVKIKGLFPVFPAKGIQIIDSFGKEQYYKLASEQAISIKFHRGYAGAYLNTYAYLQEENIPFNTEYSLLEADKEPVFYSYGTQWEDDLERSFLEYAIRLVNQSTGEEGVYYYYVPIAGNKHTNPAGFQELKANHYYRVTPRIGQLGSTDPLDPVEVDAHLILAEWNTKNLATSIDQAHYFMLKERSVVMANTDTYEVEFAASSDVEVAMVEEVYYFTWVQLNPNEKDLTTIKKSIFPGEKGYPTFEIKNTVPKSITIHSEKPQNFSPRYIRVSFIDKYGLVEQLDIEQYPARYLTSERSKAEDKDPSVYYAHDNTNAPQTMAQNNFNLFTVTTLAGGEDFNGKQYKIGDPTYMKDGKVYTHEDAAHNQLVSPRFVVASQRSIYDRVMYNRRYYNYYNSREVLSARERCANYAEGGYGVGTWRLPTEAEIEYLNALQRDINAPVKELFVGANYWSAASYRYYIFQRFTGYEGEVGMFGQHRSDTPNYKEDSYEIAGGEQVPAAGSSSMPNYVAYVDENYRRVNGNYVLSTHYYYSAFVRCIRDI